MPAEMCVGRFNVRIRLDYIVLKKIVLFWKYSRDTVLPHLRFSGGGSDCEVEAEGEACCWHCDRANPG